jgi:hypothetical protein
MNSEISTQDSIKESKKIIIAILIIISLKNLFDVFVGGGLSILQVIIDILLVVILRSRPYQLTKKYVVARALLTLPFWVIWSLISSGITLAIIVLFEELFVSIPLLMLSLGKPRTITRYVAMGIFLLLGIGSYLVMVLLVI